MFFMGIVVGWVVGHQLGVQHEARRVWRDTQTVLHPRPPAHPTQWDKDS